MFYKKTTSTFRQFTLAAIVTLLFCTISGCSSEPTSSTPDDDPSRGQITVSFETNGMEGDGSSDSPIIVEQGEELNWVINQQCSYADPDGSVITCEPKANISIKAKLDTLYAKDIKALTSMNDTPKLVSSSSGSYPVCNKTVQTFDIGGQEITFDLAYEIYRIVNSENHTIEMPYLKLNPANYGATISDESDGVTTRSLAYVTGIRLTPLNQTRGVTVTDSVEYKVSVSFNLDTECVNTKEDSRRNLSFTVDYVGVVETSTEYPDPETSFSYNLNVIGGTTDKTSPFTVTKGKTLDLEWKQNVRHTYFSLQDMEMKVLDFDLTAGIKLSAASDTLWAETVADFEKVNSSEPKVSVVTEETEKNSTNQVFDIGGQKISAEWVYEVCHGKMPDGGEISLPCLELGDLTLTSVSAVKKGGAEDVEDIGGKTVEIYEITAKFSQDLTTEGAKETVEYIVKYIGVIEVKLAEIKYRKDYVWHDPHDNIPLALQLIVYRDRIYSNGVTFTDEYRSNLMAVSKMLAPEVCYSAVSNSNEDSLIGQEGTLPWTKEKVFYHKDSMSYNDYGGG